MYICVCHLLPLTSMYGLVSTCNNESVSSADRIVALEYVRPTYVRNNKRSCMQEDCIEIA
jgi:hypothetical protein